MRAVKKRWRDWPRGAVVDSLDLRRFVEDYEMIETATVPVTIEPKATERIAELGMQTEFEQMLEFCASEHPGAEKHSGRVARSI